MKKSSITADDNIVPDPDQALQLGVSISKTDSEIAKEQRRVHETHERIMIEETASDEESDDEEESLIRRKPTGVVIRDTLRVSKKKPLDSSRKLKGIKLLSDAAQLEIDTQKAIKARKHESKRQPQTRGSSEGAGITPKVPDKPKGKSIVSSEGVDDTNVNETENEWVSIDDDEAKNDHDDDDDKSIDINETDR
ncbi:hypothetical protein Tco_0589284 [Tanacetum coccineum]